MNAPNHRLTKPRSERLPFRESLTLASLRPRDFELLLNGVVSGGMARAIREIVNEERIRAEKRSRRKASRQKA